MFSQSNCLIVFYYGFVADNIKKSSLVRQMLQAFALRACEKNIFMSLCFIH